MLYILLYNNIIIMLETFSGIHVHVHVHGTKGAVVPQVQTAN